MRKLETIHCMNIKNETCKTNFCVFVCVRVYTVGKFSKSTFIHSFIHSFTWLRVCMRVCEDAVLSVWITMIYKTLLLRVPFTEFVLWVTLFTWKKDLTIELRIVCYCFVVNFYERFVTRIDKWLRCFLYVALSCF